MQDGILRDLGKGSIFENIIQHNEYLTEQLKLQIDLAQPDLIDRRSKKILILITFCSEKTIGKMFEDLFMQANVKIKEAQEQK